MNNKIACVRRDLEAGTQETGYRLTQRREFEKMATVCSVDFPKRKQAGGWEDGWISRGGRMRSVIRLKFQFHDRAEADLEKLNQMLALQQLSKLRLLKPKAYFGTMQRFDVNEEPVETSYRSGLDGGILVCERGDGLPEYIYQISVEAVTDSTMTLKRYAALWQAGHPGRELRSLVQFSCRKGLAFAVLHHEGDSQQPALHPADGGFA